MKTFTELLAELEEKETDAEYNLRMRKTARTLKKSARKGKRKKKISKLKRRDNNKLQTAAKQKAKKEVLKGFTGSAAKKRDKAKKKSAMIDRLSKKIFKDLKKAEPQRVKAAKAAKANK
tara:strand:- start:132 stop:488 length:357 start_codon:yes stop_codon:yes gene_type:complete